MHQARGGYSPPPSLCSVATLWCSCSLMAAAQGEQEMGQMCQSMEEEEEEEAAEGRWEKEHAGR